MIKKNYVVHYYTNKGKRIKKVFLTKYSAMSFVREKILHGYKVQLKNENT